jgi:hypothetical protein
MLQMGLVGTVGLLLLLTGIFYDSVRAFYRPPDISHVVVDGVDYGTFEHMKKIGRLPMKAPSLSKPYSTLRLEKRFMVTNPSLYEWAKDSLKSPTSLKAVHIVLRNAKGQQLDEYVLECRPISLEITEDDSGRHERVDLAVQQDS